MVANRRLLGVERLAPDDVEPKCANGAAEEKSQDDGPGLIRVNKPSTEP